MTVREGLTQVQQRIALAAAQAGRSPEAITLVAVSKRQSVEQVLAAYDLGVTDFGENIAQELELKAEALAQRGYKPRWHFIGRLQRNKINMVLRYAHVIHSIDRLELVEALAHRVSEVGVDVLVQVNIGDESQKGGVAPQQAVSLAREVARQRGLRLRGLMAIPPVDEPATPYFQKLSQLSQQLQVTLEGRNAVELSMGMSHDFVEAIVCGATIVRVGTAIFGERTSSL